jgi:hypothetical protein
VWIAVEQCLEHNESGVMDQISGLFFWVLSVFCVVFCYYWAFVGYPPPVSIVKIQRSPEREAFLHSRFMRIFNFIVGTLSLLIMIAAARGQRFY